MAWEGISLPTKVLWEHLCQMAWADGSCYPSTQTLAQKLGMHIRVIKRSKAELITKKLINVFRRPNPQTDVIFPFSQFRNIEQRDKNITVLPSDILSLVEHKENNNLQKASDILSLDQCHIVTRPSDTLSPIKEKYLKENLKEEKTKEECIEPYASGNGIDTIHPVVESQTEVVKQPKNKTSKHRASREEQLNQIKSDLDTYRVEYPEINISLEMENFEYWLNNYPKGKMRKDLFLTWKNWLHREHIQQQKRKTNTKTTEQKKLSQFEEYKKYVAKVSA